MFSFVAASFLGQSIQDWTRDPDGEKWEMMSFFSSLQSVARDVVFFDLRLAPVKLTKSLCAFSVSQSISHSVGNIVSFQS